MQIARTAENDKKHAEIDKRLGDYLQKYYGFSLSDLEDAPEFVRMHMQKAIEMAQKVSTELESQTKQGFEMPFDNPENYTDNDSGFTPEVTYQEPDSVTLVGANIEVGGSLI